MWCRNLLLKSDQPEPEPTLGFKTKIKKNMFCALSAQKEIPERILPHVLMASSAMESSNWRYLGFYHPHTHTKTKCIHNNLPVQRVSYGEDPYRKTVVFHLSALKPRALVASKAPRGCYDFDKPENITDLYRQSNQTTWKNSVIRSYRKPLEPGWKLKIQLLAEFCPPSVWHKICWYREQLESFYEENMWVPF